MLAVSGEITNANDFKKIVIKKDHRKIFAFSELAEVSFGFLEPSTYSRLNQKEAYKFCN